MSLRRVESDGIERRDMALLTPLPVRRGQKSDAVSGRTDDPLLTPRQREVLDGLVRGLANKEIAAELGVGPDAVKRTISRLLSKLNAPSRTALVEIALRSSAARLRRSPGPKALSLLDAAPIPALVTRGQTHCVDYANPAARALFNISEVGMPLIELFPPTVRSSVRAIADASFATSRQRVARGLVLRDASERESPWRHADVFASPVHDGAGQLAGLIVFLVDASQRSAAP